MASPTTTVDVLVITSMALAERARTLAEVQPLYRQLGATVRRLRKANGWSQDVLSDRSGLHRAHIGEIERGETNVTSANAQDACGHIPRGRIPEYQCHRAWTNGSCSNRLRVRVVDMNEAVLHAVEEHALTPEAIERVIQFSERDDEPDRQTKLAREQQDVEQRIARLVAAIETGGGDLPSLLTASANWRSARLPSTPNLANCRPDASAAPCRDRRPVGGVAAAAAPVDDARAHGVAADAAWAGHVHTACETRSGRSRIRLRLRGTDALRQAVRRGCVAASPHRLDPAIVGDREYRPRDTFDGDYGRLLDRAFQKGWCARRDSNPRPTGSKPVALSN